MYNGSLFKRKNELLLICITDTNQLFQMTSRELYDACRFGDLPTVQRFVESGILIDAPIYAYETPLTVSIHNRHIEIMHYLIEKGANIFQTNYKGTTLHCAASSYYENIEICKFLLEKGVDINARGEHGETALMTALRFENHKNASFLIDSGANIHISSNCRNIVNYSFRDLDILERVIGMGADVNNKGGLPPLLEISLTKEHAKILVRAGADLNCFIYENEIIISPLFYSVCYGDRALTEYLVEMGISVFDDSTLRCMACEWVDLFEKVIQNRAFNKRKHLLTCYYASY